MGDNGEMERLTPRSDEWIPLGSDDLEFDVYTELRRATVDIIRGGKPRSVLSVLLMNRERESIPIDEIAEQLGKPIGEVEWSVEMLQGEDLCERIDESGSTKVVPFAAYSVRNAV
jgi:hypothetical protein